MSSAVQQLSARSTQSCPPDPAGSPCPHRPERQYAPELRRREPIRAPSAAGPMPVRCVPPRSPRPPAGTAEALGEPMASPRIRRRRRWVRLPGRVLVGIGPWRPVRPAVPRDLVEGLRNPRGRLCRSARHSTTCGCGWSVGGEQRCRKARSLDQLVPAVVLAFKVRYRLHPESWSATSRSAHRLTGAVQIDESRVTRPFRPAVWTVDRVGPGRRFGGARAV